MYQQLLYNLGLSSYQPINSSSSQPSSSTTDGPPSRPPNIKGFFANERTFLSWAHFSLVLGGLSVGLVNFTDSSAGMISASAFALVSMALMAYAYFKFRVRAAKLHNREQGYYDDLKTPVILVVVVILTVALNFWVNYIAQLL